MALSIGAAAAVAGPPERVVSINLCTDQLAMLLAGPGQLVSVSYLARDPRSSAMAEAAEAWPANGGRAEDIFLLDPELVVAGSFTTPETVRMLQRLGIPVALFPHASSLADVGAQLRQMGAVLGRPEAGEAAAAEFEAALAELAEEEGEGPTAALYQAGGWTGGRHSLAGEILAAAGLRNLAEDLGMAHGGWLALEQLVLAEPELLVTGRPFPGASRAEEITGHPALRRAMDGRAGVALTDRDWVCGLPHVLNAVRAMRDAAEPLR